MEKDNSMPKNKRRLDILAAFLCVAIVVVAAGVLNMGRDTSSSSLRPTQQSIAQQTITEPSLIAAATVIPETRLIEVVLGARDAITGNPIANTQALSLGQRFLVDVYLRSGPSAADTITDVTLLQFDISRLTAATLTTSPPSPSPSPIWESTLFHGDPYTLDPATCDFGDNPDLLDCNYFAYDIIATNGIFAAAYLWPWAFDGALPVTVDQNQTNGSTINNIPYLTKIATLDLTFPTTPGLVGYIDVCGPPHEWTQSGIAIISGGYTSTPIIFSEFVTDPSADRGQVNCNSAKLTLAAAPATRVGMDAGNCALSRYTDPPSGAIDARAPIKLDGTHQGFDRIDIRFTGAVSSANVSVADFNINQEINPKAYTTARPPQAVPAAPTVGSLAFNPSDTRVPGFDGHNVVRLFFNDANKPMNYGSWIRITHIPSHTSAVLAFWPGNVNQDDNSGPADLTALVHFFNGQDPTHLQIWQWDINGSGTQDFQGNTSKDTKMLTNLLNGKDSGQIRWRDLRMPEDDDEGHDDDENDHHPGEFDDDDDHPGDCHHDHD